MSVLLIIIIIYIIKTLPDEGVNNMKTYLMHNNYISQYIHVAKEFIDDYHQ